MKQNPFGFQATLLCAVILSLSLHAGDAMAAKRKSKHKSCEGEECIPHKSMVRSSSIESKKERERRLSRECKGRPNAGACLGYGG